MTSAGNEELQNKILLCLAKPNLHERAEAVEALITASNQQLLRELEGQAEVYPEKGIGSITPVRAVPLAIIQDKLKEIK